MSTIQNTGRTLTLAFDGHESEIEVDVAYIHEPAIRGSRERGSGLQLEPDEPEGIEVLSVLTSGDKPRDITTLIPASIITAIEVDILAELQAEA